MSTIFAFIKVLFSAQKITLEPDCNKVWLAKLKIKLICREVFCFDTLKA